MRPAANKHFDIQARELLNQPAAIASLLHAADSLGCCGLADGQNGPAVIAACAARRWLGRNAAGVKAMWSHEDAPPAACASLVACLPALQYVSLSLPWSLYSVDMDSLLEALAWLPSLRELHLGMTDDEVDGSVEPLPYLGCALAFGGLRSLAELGLAFSAESDTSRGGDADCVLIDVVGALATLTGFVGLTVTSFQPAEVPRCLGELEGLRSLEFTGFSPCELEDGCLDLPNLESLVFNSCNFEDTEVLPGASALQRLTHIEFSDGEGPRFFDPQLARLPRLQHMEFNTFNLSHVDGDGGLGLPQLPADMGPLAP